MAFSTELAVLLFAALTAIIMVVIVWQALVERDPMTKRLNALAERRNELKARALAGSPVTTGKDKKKKKGAGSKKGIGVMRDVVDRMNLMTDKRSDSARHLLHQAGYRGKDAPVIFTFCKVVGPLVFGIVAALYIALSSKFNPSPALAVSIAMGSAGLGFFLPTLLVKSQAKKRQKALRKALPDAIDLLVICAEAGLGLDAALARVVRETGRSAPIMADELGLLSIELNFLGDRRQAFQNLNDRTNMEEFRSIINTLQQSEKYGTPLAQALRVLSAEFRNDRMMRAETKAARLPAILTVPMMIFILPCLFIVLIGPAVLRVIDAFTKMGS